MEAIPLIIKERSKHIIVLPKAIMWEAAPRGMPIGSKAKLINGNPKIPSFFTLRHKISADWKVMPHFHPSDEYITVIHGSCFLGTGETFDEERATELPVGALSIMPAGTVHFFFTKQVCEIQVQAMGPQKIIYLDANDDPRQEVNKIL